MPGPIPPAEPAAALPGPLALVVALRAERRALSRAIGLRRPVRVAGIPLTAGRLAGREVLLVQAGIGVARARRCLAALGRAVPLAGVWSLGYAGGLSPEARLGDLVCPDRVLGGEAGPDLSPPTPERVERVLAGLAAAGTPAHRGALLTVGAPLRTPESKRAAAARTGAVAVDMEAGGVAEAAAALGIPWLALKVVLDPADRDLPASLLGCTAPDGNPRWSRILRALAAGSEVRRALWAMGTASRLASAALAAGLEPALAAWAHLDAPRSLQ